LYHAVFDEADLRDARLHQAVLIGARGSGAVFTKADLTDVYAPRAVLQKATFSDAKLESANWLPQT
jgi:uncharacterized protein YjbI with pentapeptide repeats